MLRALVLLFLMVNAGLYWWLNDNPQALQADREPQRLNHQVTPDAVQVLPDLPAASAPRRGASAASANAAPASNPDVVAAAATPPAASAAGLPRSVAAATLACSETPPLNDSEYTTLKAALIKAGLSDSAIGERRQNKGGAWIVYVGKFADNDARQDKISELRKLDLKADPVNSPVALAPGLSLGTFTSPGDATKRLDELAKRGVHGARVAILDAPIVLRHLQVHASDASWRKATIGQRFDSCPADAASSS